MIESEVKEIYNEYISEGIEKYIEAITTTFSLYKHNKALNLEDKKDGKSREEFYQEIIAELGRR